MSKMMHNWQNARKIYAAVKRGLVGSGLEENKGRETYIPYFSDIFQIWSKSARDVAAQRTR